MVLVVVVALIVISVSSAQEEDRVASRIRRGDADQSGLDDLLE